MLYSKVKKNILRFSMIGEGERVVLALSGGMDSMCLLEILLRLREEIPFTLECAHLHHGIRGASADDDAHFVVTECEKRGILCHFAKKDIPALAKERGQGLEECGREERYAFFRSLGMDKILTAHHADDQAETILMNLLRGSGSEGLSGMNPCMGDIVRPLLSVSRKEIEEYVTMHHIPYREDETNQDTEYFRNSIRHRVLTVMEELRGGASLKISACAEKIREDQEYLNSLSREAYASVTEEDTRRSVSVSDLKKLPVPIRRRVLSMMLSHTGFVGAELLKSTEELLFGESGKRLSLSGGFVAERVYENLVIRKEEEELSFAVRVSPGEEVALPDGRTLLWGEGLSVDADKVPKEFTIRTRRQGDRFIPSGMSGSKKIKDFFIDEKIPREERTKALILEDKEGIFALYPYRVAERVKCTCDTKKILKIKIKG